MHQDLRLLFLFPALPQLRIVIEHASRRAWLIWLLPKLRSGVHASDSMFRGQSSILRSGPFRHSSIDTAKTSLLELQCFAATKKMAPFPSGAMGYKADATLVSN